MHPTARSPLVVLTSCISLSLAAAAGCGGTARDPGAGSSGNATDGAAAISVPSSYDANAVSAAQAQCNAPHGPAVSLSSVDQTKRDFAGSWLLCAGDDGMQTMFAPGISLLPDGTWYRLGSDGAGGLVRLQGVQSQGTWGLACYDGDCSSALHLFVYDAGGDLYPFGCGGGPLSFESSPSRAHLADETCTPNDYRMLDLWLVPLVMP